MADTMLDLIESIDTRDAYAPGVWTRDEAVYNIGVTAGRLRRGARPDPRDPAAVQAYDRYNRGLLETARLFDRVRSGALPALWLREAMSTSDFSLLFGDIIDRQMLGNYAEVAQTFRQIMRMGTVPDFRSVNRMVLNGGEGILDEVKELAEYKAAKLSPAKYAISVKKYGRRMPFSFEAMINDDLDALTDTPNRFARAARRSEQKFATAIYVSSTGPNSTIYSNANKNIVNIANGAASNNPALSEAALIDAFTVLGNQRDSDGEPIVIEGAILEVPPELEVTALKILNATEIEVGTDASGQRIRTANWLRGKLTLVVNPYLSIINTTSGKTAWYIHARSNTNRPAFEFAFLRGYDAPQLFMKSPNAVRVGGGAVDPMQGSFDDDSIDYKIRHIFGGGPLDPKATLASAGTGS